MKRGSGSTASIWMETTEVPARAALAKDITADVCIVGAGIAGLTPAYLLTEEGKAVVVVDDGPYLRHRRPRSERVCNKSTLLGYAGSISLCSPPGCGRPRSADRGRRGP
jgi:choline dehydrogenase-like flavoprotein